MAKHDHKHLRQSSGRTGTAPRSVRLPGPAGMVLQKRISGPGREPRWVGTDEVVEVAGRTIAGGLFYLGSPTGISNGILNETIPPEIPAGVAIRDLLRGDRYYRSFQELHVLAQRAYIDWLASDRSSDKSARAFVLLYFYALERRLMVGV
jgi:hypothetical protein